jgi:hypothetical protein
VGLRKELVWIYYAAIGALIIAGITLWVTGHGTGDPYLSFGIALAFLPIVVTWIRRRFDRD